MNFILSVFLVTIAGLSTIIGSIIIFTSKNKSHNKLGFLLGFSAGIMLCICIKELLPESQEMLADLYDYPLSSFILVLSLILGFCLSLVLDSFLHHHDEEQENDEHCKMCNIGITTAVMLALHKLPEGLAIFVAINDNLLTIISFSIAIAIHHIPEGMIISAPIYYATGDKKKALLYSLASGLVLPISGLLGFIFLESILTGMIEGILMGVTSAIMLYITLKEIIPGSLKYSNKKTTVFAVILGIIFMYLLELL